MSTQTSIQCYVCQCQSPLSDPYLINLQNECVCISCMLSGEYKHIIKDQLTLVDNRQKIPQSPTGILPVRVQSSVVPEPHLISLLADSKSHSSCVEPHIISLPTNSRVINDMQNYASYNHYLKYLLSIIEVEEKTNTVISPLSLAIVVAMIGSTNINSKLPVVTLNNLFATQNLCNFGKFLINEGDINLTTLTLIQAMIIPQNHVLTDVTKDIFEDDFDCRIFTNVSSQSINQWVQACTARRITKIISPDFHFAEQDIISLNVYFFKDKWLHNFDINLTTEETFYTNIDRNIEISRCQMMHTTQKILYIQDSHESGVGTQCILLPYKNSTLAAVIILNNQHCDLSQLFINCINAWPTTWKKMKEAFFEDVSLSLPKFKFDVKGLNLKPTLQRLNLDSIFTNCTEVAAETVPSSLKIDMNNIYQSLFFEVNEGETALGVATNTTTSCQILEPKYVMKCDHPFIFNIVNFKNGMIHFTAVINNPSL